MGNRTARDPSPLRSGLAHAGLSCAAFTALTLGAGIAIHIWGDASTASPVRQIALFDTSEPGRPQLKTRFANTDSIRRPDAARPADAHQTVFTQDETSPSLGVYYGDDDTRGQDAQGPASTSSGAASSDTGNTVRINGVAVSAGKSWQATQRITALPSAPISAVTAASLPVISADGRTPAGVYARPFANPENRPTVSITLGGLGINRTHTRSAIEELPPEVTLSFAPTTNDLQGWIDRARAAGHEVLLEVPMEPYDFGRERPHPQTLLVSQQPAQIASRLENLMSRASGYFGITNYQGSKFAADEAGTRKVADALAARGVAFIEDGSFGRSGFAAAADADGLRYRRADTQIDTRPSGEEIQTRLLELETIAFEQGASLGSGFAYPVTIDILKAWTQQLDEKGIVLAPASAVTRATRLPSPAVDTAEIEPATGGQEVADVLNTSG